ncbi:MAG: dethiobiotin synthase [Deltaproteobacteria bacterium]|nr:dethiobiotin synthase [Deltaproteobacteria bacterium]
MEKSNKKADIFFVAGTDTGVGKTVFSLLLMQFFYAKGYDPFYLKPLQTGCKDPYDTDSDAAFIYRNVKPLEKKDPADSMVYCFKNPKAPYFAARDRKKNIDFKRIENVVEEKSRFCNPLIIEAAGGLFVPVNEKLLIIDMIKRIKAQPILVARAGLGTINHTLLSIEALSHRGIKPAGLVFMDVSDPPVSKEMVTENMEAVEKFSDVKVSGVIGKIHDFSNPGKKCFESVERIFKM